MWIQVYKSVMVHEKTRHLSKLLNQSLLSSVGMLISLWLFASEAGDENGVLRYISPECLANVLDYDGDPETVIDALCRAGYLARGDNPETLIVTGWKKWQIVLTRKGKKKD